MTLLRRKRIIAIAGLLGMVGAAVPIVTLGWLSSHIAERKEHDVLKMLGSTALENASRAFQAARSALETVQSSTLSPCSDEHIALMRDITINSPTIVEIGYFANDQVQCTSWGKSTEVKYRQPTDYISEDGLPVTLRLRPAASFSGLMTAVYSGNYGVLINPAALTDLATDPSIDIAILTGDGQVISEKTPSGISRKASMETRNGLASDGKTRASVVRRKGLTAIVIDNDPGTEMLSTEELLILLPVGILLGSLLVGAAFWFAKQRLSPQAELSLAIKRKELVVHYQPIIALKSDVCVGAEALVRWRKPDGTLLGPDYFIPLAEETGLIQPLTDCVVETIIEELGNELTKDRTLHVAINVSAADIQSGRIVDMLDQKLRKTNVKTEQIWLEATEHGFIDIRAAKLTLERARNLGHSVAIDDFGTGYSSLQYLQGLPLDALKIDKAFVKSINKHSATSTVTLHIIEMAKELGLFTVAEGVETLEQAQFLNQNGVDFVQGWLYSRPLPFSEFIKFQRDRNIRFGKALEIIQANPTRSDSTTRYRPKL
ncbi:EAL domain-containing protein [Brucella intermedia]|uniref:EAL domain-containing protein n=1 Tax=Brucella intermedia TaxID=94625 RepID=UPI00124D9F00|nr:EAL domain-containing protein [Brucella intermedia]KAB2722392.1 EAL domain-containing protein [Brucella intermedia]